MRQKDDGPGTSCHPRGRHEHVVFVLGIECSKYVTIVEGSGDELLVGCRCAVCGGSDLRLTGSRVERRLDVRQASVMLEVALARCRGCRHRERVLPFEALPGKVTGVDVILDAVGQAFVDGAALTSIAGAARVVSRTIKTWMLGLGARVLDLERLYRHRARRAP